MQLHFSVTFACCGNVEILLSTWCEAEVVQILKRILGKNYWCADSPGLQVYKSASLQVCKSAGLQVCKSAGLQVCKSAVCKCRTPDVGPQRIFDFFGGLKNISRKKSHHVSRLTLGYLREEYEKFWFFIMCQIFSIWLGLSGHSFLKCGARTSWTRNS